MSWASSSKGGGKSQLYEQILVCGRPDPTVLAMLNLAAEASVELWRRKTAAVIPKLLIRRDINVREGRGISKLDLETIIQEDVDLMLMKTSKTCQ